MKPKRQIKVAKHARWQAAQQAGVLHCGRLKVGQVYGQKHTKAERSRRACREKVADLE